MTEIDYSEKETFLLAGLVVGALLSAIVCLVMYAVNTEIDPLPIIQTGGSIAVGMSAVVAFMVFRANSYKAVSDDLKRISLDYLQESKLLLERAYDTLTVNKTTTPPPNNRLVWLTTARLLKSYEEMKGKITESDHYLIIEEHEEYWRHQFYTLLHEENVGFPESYYDPCKQSRTLTGMNLAPVSLAVVYAFSNWPDGKKDSLNTVDVASLFTQGNTLLLNRGLNRYLEGFEKLHKEIEEIKSRKNKVNVKT